MNRTKIEWVRNPPDNKEIGFTWNPIVGCNGVGCAVREKCYARKLAKRFKHRCQRCYDFIPHYHTERYREPLQRKKPAGIFVCSMGELFDSALGWGLVAPILNVMWECPQHRFYILTKQPQNAKNYPEYPDNVWVGVSVNRKSDLWRISELRKINAKIKFVSFEPLYEDIAFDVVADLLGGIDWIVIGAQTRPTLQPDPQWVENLIGLSYAAGNYVAVFLKDNLKWPEKTLEKMYPEDGK